MLAELHVVDLGIVADLDLLLAPGLTAITGETGAGRALIVEALELLVGGGADASLVRDGSDEARVEGRFVDPDTGDETVFRTYDPTRRSGPRLRQRPARDRERARRLGATLVDLYGQHAHQSLLDPAVRRRARPLRGCAPGDTLAAYRAARATSAASTATSPRSAVTNITRARSTSSVSR